jgi:hypothetical protein
MKYFLSARNSILALINFVLLLINFRFKLNLISKHSKSTHFKGMLTRENYIY